MEFGGAGDCVLPVGPSCRSALTFPHRSAWKLPHGWAGTSTSDGEGFGRAAARPYHFTASRMPAPPPPAASSCRNILTTAVELNLEKHERLESCRPTPDSSPPTNLTRLVNAPAAARFSRFLGFVGFVVPTAFSRVNGPAPRNDPASPALISPRLSADFQRLAPDSRLLSSARRPAPSRPSFPLALPRDCPYS